MDCGLETLLSLDGFEHTYENGYWYKVEAAVVENSEARPHGIKYSLTFHDRYNRRLFGMDNAHGITSGKKYQGRLVVYDHLHKNAKDKGKPYEFSSAEQLLQDFFTHVNKILENL